jgi:hypothetical protein
MALDEIYQLVAQSKGKTFIINLEELINPVTLCPSASGSCYRCNNTLQGVSWEDAILNLKNITNTDDHENV